MTNQSSGIGPRMPHLPQPSPSQDGAVPTYNLEIYVKQDAESGMATARMANLAIPDVQASNPRDAIRQLVENGKKAVREAVAHCHPIPWVAPKLEMEAGENRFLVAMHL